MFQIDHQAIGNTGPWKMKIKITLKIKLKSFLNSDFAHRMDCPRIKNEAFMFSVMWVFNLHYGAKPVPYNITKSTSTYGLFLLCIPKITAVTKSTTSKTNIHQ